MEVQRFALEFGLEMFVLYHMTNNLEIKFWVQYTLVATNCRAVITRKMCKKLTFGHRFDNNFRMVRNFWIRLECFGKYTFEA